MSAALKLSKAPPPPPKNAKAKAGEKKPLPVKIESRGPGRPPLAVPQVTIEKGIPIPIADTPMAFPFGDMEPGDSFFVPCSLERVSMHARIRSRFRYWSMRQCPRVDMAITVQRVDGGLRCWRTA